MPVLYLTEADVTQLVTPDMAIAAVEAGLRKISLDEAVNIPRSRCQTDHVVLHVLPAAAKTLGAIGFKAYTTGQFPAQFCVYLFDPKHGHLIAMIEADALGQYRTGAASAVATNKLARSDAATIGLLGTGKQATTQLECISRVRTITKVQVYSREAKKRESFAREMTEKVGVPVEAAATAEAAVRGQDIIVTATSCREPVLFGDWISPGMHINLTGSNYLAKVEAHVDVFRKANLITVDSKDQARIEAGDFVIPIRDGVFGWSDVLDLSHILVGRYPGRGSEQDVTIFKSLGLGVEDIALGTKIVESARARGIGREVQLG